MVSSDELFSLRDCFIAATELTAYLTAIRNKSMVLGSRYVPSAVKSVGEQAAKGNLEAAKLLFEFLGLKVKAPVTQVATQVQINVPVLKDIIDIDSEGNVIADITRGG